MLTTDRLFVAPSAALYAPNQGVLGVAIDWEQAAAIQDRMATRFPTRRALARVDTMTTAGIIRLLGVDEPFKRAPDGLPYVRATALNTAADGENVTRISDIVVPKLRLMAGTVMEFSIDEWEDIEEHAGEIVATGVLEAAGVLKPARTVEQYENVDHDVVLARESAQRQFPDVIQLTFAAGVA